MRNNLAFQSGVCCMKWSVSPSRLEGSIRIPPSKSHTIRALLVATAARGESRLGNPLMKGDGASALGAAMSLGALSRQEGDNLFITGIGGDLSGGQEDIWLGNSGTGLNLFMSLAAVGDRARRFDGDASLRSRPVRNLLDALTQLGASYTVEEGSSGLPFRLKGPLQGGSTTVTGLTSQYLSSLLFAAPLLPQDSVITVNDLHERPYVDLSLWWLDRLGIRYETVRSYECYRVFGRQQYPSIDMDIPGDFSGATFAAVGAAITGSRLELKNIDFSDPQGDKAIFGVLENAGVKVERTASGAIVDARGVVLRGLEIDLNAMPDALPAFAVFGCCATGETRLVNVKQARIKETDRIAVMARELSRMGADVRELDDGLVLRKSSLTGCDVHGHDDHRVVMSLALAGLVASGTTVIDSAESADVTYPGFLVDYRAIGADICCI